MDDGVRTITGVASSSGASQDGGHFAGLFPLMWSVEGYPFEVALLLPFRVDVSSR
jgi:hypothetical protein